MINAKHHQEQSVEKQITGVLTTTKKETTENEMIEEKHDPVSSVIEHFASIDQVTEQSKPDIRQLEHTTEHLTTMLVKEKKKVVQSKSTINEQSNPLSQPLESRVNNKDDSVTTMWQAAKLNLHSAYLVVEQHSFFEPSNHFTIIHGSDPFPNVSYTDVDTSIPGEQQVRIQVTDSKGLVTTSEFTIMINSIPKITVEQPLLFQRIGQPMDLRKGVFASDNEEGDLTSAIHVETNLDTTVEGEYEVIYTVKDQHGAQHVAHAEIRVVNDAPIISAPVVIEQAINESFSIFNYVEVKDAEDGNIPLNETNIIETDFIPNKEGIYYFKIGNVKDQYGKLAMEKIVEVTIINEAPEIIQADMKVNVFSQLSKEAYLAQVIVSDREDAEKKLAVEVDEDSWSQVKTSELGEYRVLLQVTDTNGKSSKAYGVITVINEPPVFLGVKDREIVIGEVFDPLAEITVHDREEKLLPEIEVSGTFNSTLPGTYLVYLSVRDSFERVTTSYQLNVLATKENMETGE
ncbi:DUF5011 domain-containing protein [Enterococcus durans]|uniref:DUF5011 domain-containing protein n=2 Tax=Enterococcus durans TaxID=53345 RepID=A0A5N0YT24_9ENTE|nr:immunoglobulin-like domain-containing protein [Enterococcus durans]KAA9178769.1 DUF5011 domain-containing protein [Enterococcus durans]KAA9185887.1 DUF5011 domain-containing protein [Enterococcus durans]KAA9193329.1 DUF5011 domain-containing protein [Enterococcus durans]KAA9194428.1 DUF5011 domain-containing protein [Enterococcus durans]KAA9198926.1 DUF5011 domain-containing protein [Enterococcus durans]